MTDMIDRLYDDVVEREIAQAMIAMFPHGAGTVSHHRVAHHLEHVAKRAFEAGKSYALMGLMTSDDVAEHFGVSKRRANALIKNRHERFGAGMRFGNQWLIHRDELDSITPLEKHNPRQSDRG